MVDGRVLVWMLGAGAGMAVRAGEGVLERLRVRIGAGEGVSPGADGNTGAMWPGGYWRGVASTNSPNMFHTKFPLIQKDCASFPH